MKLYLDLDTLQMIESPGYRTPAQNIRFKRGDGANVELYFLQSGTTPTLLANHQNLEISLGLKVKNRYDGSYLVLAQDWTLPVPPFDTAYRTTLNLNTVQLNSLLGIDSDLNNDIAEAEVMGEVSWRELPDGMPISSRIFAATIENDVNRGDESVPVDADPPYPASTDVLTASDAAITNWIFSTIYYI